MTTTTTAAPVDDDLTAPAAPRLIGPYLHEGRVRGSATYADPVDPDLLLDSVTTVISACTSKPWLTPWAAKIAATYAVEKHALVEMLITESGQQAAIDHVSREAMRLRDAAADAGTIVHDYVEALVLDTALPPLPEGTDPEGDLAKSLDAFLDWHIAFEPVYLMSEATVANPAHGWAGTLDLVAYLPGFDRTFVIDAKSGKNLDAWMPVQLGTYKSATEVWLPFGQKAPMPRTDGAAVLHLRPTGWKFYEVTVDPLDPDDEPAYDVFRRMHRQYGWAKAAPKRIGRALYPPLPDGSQPPALLEDCDGLGAACGALIRAGVRDVADLAALGADRLQAIDGVGPKTLPLVRMLLRDHGLVMAGLDGAIDELVEKARKAAEKAEATAVKRAEAHAAGKHAAKPIRGCAACATDAQTEGG